MEADEKKCPKCAETIKAEAVVCRFCGHPFTETATATNASAAAPSPSAFSGKNIGIGCLAVVVLLVVIGMVSDGGSTGTTAGSGAADGSVAASAPAMDATAAELVKAYGANEAAAQQRYGASPLRVAATVHSIDLGFDDKPYLILDGGDMFNNPHADLDEASQAQAGSLVKGGKVTLVCQSVSELAGTPMLKDCSLQ